MGSCWDIRGQSVLLLSTAESPWLELAEAHLKYLELNPYPMCTCECKQGSALQVSYGFVFSTSGDSTLALTHQNLSQVAL